ncbi:hypothetical protein GS03_02085 [Flavobacterium sangjuense]|uniref:Uncharacterized protein n=1 Tax=Flavobacterium sangjuense TaxID=2518177 RepID=A0A4P7PUY6_9FLAO|nr:hypothetical protein GS03_02085 [Flavobacterium sangjuense]
MLIQKNTEPIILIIVTSVVLYSIIRSKKLNYLGHHLRHHIIKPSMKTLRMKSITERELKREMVH